MLRAQAAHTSAAARGMLGKTSEVAAAAEQYMLCTVQRGFPTLDFYHSVADGRKDGGES